MTRLEEIEIVNFLDRKITSASMNPVDIHHSIMFEKCRNWISEVQEYQKNPKTDKSILSLTMKEGLLRKISTTPLFDNK
ncbi:MAG: hypothetical protein ACKVOU_03600 [Cytophagales bacterium]